MRWTRRAMAVAAASVVVWTTALSAHLASAASRATRRSDVVYRRVDGKDLALDLLLPAASADDTNTLVVLIHGGGWVGGDKAQTMSVAEQLVSAGYSVAALNYRLADEDRFPAAADDVTAALDYLTSRGNTSSRLGSSQIVLLGSSAGGELAALVGATDDRVDAVIGWSGIYDVSMLGDETVAYLGCTASECPSLVTAASPIDWVDADDPPVLLVHAEDDPIVPAEQATRYAAALADAGVSHELDMISGSAHAEQLGDVAVDATLQFLAEMRGERRLNASRAVRRSSAGAPRALTSSSARSDAARDDLALNLRDGAAAVPE